MATPAVGFQGFLCPNGHRWGQLEAPLEFCTKECQMRCLSMPMLVALAQGGRDVVPHEYHVTEILDPPQKVYLKRHKPYWIAPQTMVWAIYGTAIHNIMESGHDEAVRLGVNDRFNCEQSFEVQLDGTVLKGRYDLYDKIDKTLWDYKSIKQYMVERLMAGDFTETKYPAQLNIYRAFGCPEAEHIKIEAIVKDWSQQAKMDPVVDIDIPIWPDEFVKEYVKSLLKIHEDAEATGVYRECLPDELWFPKSPRSKNFGIPVRCRDYCEVSSVCEQYKEWRKNNAR